MLIVCVLMISSGVAHEPYQCPADFPDEPILSEHLDHEGIVNGAYRLKEVFAAGKRLFSAQFNICDGQGRPATTGTGERRLANQPSRIRTSAPDADSCAGCHAQPRAGGGGDFVANVFVLAQALDPVTDSVAAEFSNERNTLGMFGSGAIEMLAREMSVELQNIRKSAISQAVETGSPVTRSLVAKGVGFGSITAYADGFVDTGQVQGIDPDLVVKPFHQAGVVVSLREFTVNAFNHHHGMQAEERFDLNPANDFDPDFDEDGVSEELTIGDITAVTLWQAGLAAPAQVRPRGPIMRQAARRGESLFEAIGCSFCHRPELGLNSRFFEEPNPFNPPGTFRDTSQSVILDLTRDGQKPGLERVGDGAIVRAYTDLKRHNLCDAEEHREPIRHFCNEQLDQGRPAQQGRLGAEYFLTRKLWDVGSSAPYGHRGDLTTITEAIFAHGGEARVQRDSFVALPTDDQAAIVHFLKTLQVVPASNIRRAGR